MVGKKCAVIGCAKVAVAHGLCDMHRKRKERHGDTDVGRPVDWGRHKHPLNSIWRGFMRYHKQDCPEWWEFQTFVKDVGEKPGVPVRFCKKDGAAPYGPTNWFWQEIDKLDATTEVRKRRLASQKAYRARVVGKNPEYFRDKDLRKNYGVTLEWYNEQYAKQQGVCAICGRPETAVIRGKLLRLAVDHCHYSGKVRGLLCRMCNNGIGHFLHDTSLLQKAVHYLQHG